jgi:O-antigen/teichoic acid export membrane protein
LAIVYGNHYGVVHIAFAVLTIYTLFYIAGNLIVSVYFAIGRPEIHRWFILMQFVLMVIFIYPAVKWGQTNGAAITKLLCMVLAGMLQLVVLKKLFDLPICRYIKSAEEGILLALAVTPAALILRYWIDLPWQQLLGCVVLFCLTWLIGIWLVRKSVMSLFDKTADPVTDESSGY